MLVIIFFYFPSLPGSSFQFKNSFQKTQCMKPGAAGVCSQLGPGPPLRPPIGPGTPGSTSWWGRVGRPSTGPYCPSLHCLVHALCSEDGGQRENVIPGLLFPSLAPRPHSDTENAPWGGGRGSAKWGLVLPLSHHLPGNRSCKLLVGGFFFSLLGGVFFLHPPGGGGAFGERICSLS